MRRWSKIALAVFSLYVQVCISQVVHTTAIVDGSLDVFPRPSFYDCLDARRSDFKLCGQTLISRFPLSIKASNSKNLTLIEFRVSIHRALGSFDLHYLGHSIPMAMSILANTISNVVQVASEEEVQRVHAGRVVTFMKNVERYIHCSMRHSPCDSMSQKALEVFTLA